MCQRKSAREQVSLFTRAQFRDRQHRCWNPGGFARACGCTHRLVRHLDIVDEVLVIGTSQDEHALGPRRAVEKLTYAIKRYRNDELAGQEEGGDRAGPVEGELQAQNDAHSMASSD